MGNCNTTNPFTLIKKIDTSTQSYSSRISYYNNHRK